MAGTSEHFNPGVILAALERNYVDYVLIGGLARVLRGAPELTRGVDVCPSVAASNVEHLAQAVRELNGRPAGRGQPTLDQLGLAAEEPIALTAGAGELKIVAVPAGVPTGFADLRRAATREDLGRGVRPLVASTADLARMTAALRREQHIERLRALRRILELEVEREPVASVEVQSPSEVTRGPREWARLRQRDHERGMER
jgi:hypothetical protein